MRKSWLLAALVAATPFFTTPVQAQVRGADWGTFIGASIGDSDLDTSLKLYGGQLVTQNWGWEAAYIDFGARTNRAVTTEASAVGVSLLGVLPLTQTVSGFGKIGVYYVDTEVSTPVSFRSDSDIELGVGVGLRLAINPQFSLRLEFESIGGEGGDLVSIGAQLRF